MNLPYRFFIVVTFCIFFSCNHKLQKTENNTKSDTSILDKQKAKMESRRINHIMKEFAKSSADLARSDSEMKKDKYLSALEQDDILDFRPARVNDSILYTTNNFRSRKFTKEIICEDTTFSQDMDFTFATFSKKFNVSVKFSDFLEFSYATFEDDASLGPSSIDGDAEFHEVTFKKNAYFDGFDVRGEAHFNRDSFSQAGNFYNSNFDEDAIFEGSLFLKNASFADTRFRANVNFNNASFLKDADFTNARFSDIGSFKALTLTDSTHFQFKGAILPDTLDFSFNNEVAKEIDLSNCSFSDSLRYDKKTDVYFRPHYINLYKTDISKFHLDYIHFRLITDSIVNNDGKKIKIPKDEAESMYEALLNNFKTRGQIESYKLLDIEYQEYKWANSFAPTMVIFPKYWWNFGYDKEYVFIWAGFFLLFFTLISFFCLTYLNDVYTLEKIGQVTSFTNDRFTVKESFIRMWHSFVYTSTIFFRLTLKVEAINYNRFWGTMYIIVMYTVGLICLAYMANFILQK